MTTRMDQRPLALLAGFLLLWWVILPKAGVPT
jgi:hypothetical protein